jgi:hypothetical protein
MSVSDPLGFDEESVVMGGEAAFGDDAGVEGAERGGVGAGVEAGDLPGDGTELIDDGADVEEAEGEHGFLGVADAEACGLELFYR